LNILFDTNVILDVLLKRKKLYEASSFLMNEVEKSRINGFLCANSVTVIHYLLGKVTGAKEATKNIKLILELFEIAPVNRAVLFESLSSKFKDYEDAVIHQSAIAVNADGIVTNNLKDFKASKIPAYSPLQLVKIISGNI